MNKQSYLLKSLLLFIVLISSCKKDFLNTNPLGEFSETAVWKDPALAQTFINQIYWRLDEPFTNGRIKGNLVDEAHYRGNGPSKNFNNGLLTADDIPGWSTPSRFRTWNELYKSIRYCNLFLEKVDIIPYGATPIDGKTTKDRVTGEVHFLRAFNYFLLASVYAGVPIIKESYGLTDDFSIARNTYAETISFIVEECDKAAALLPRAHTGSNKGRATRGAALALKSRVLLYAASDLYNTNVFPNYANPELIGYKDANRTARWQAAKDAAKAVMNENLYSLYKANPAPGDSVAQNIVELFTLKETPEDIFVKFFTPTSSADIGLVSGPNGWHNWGINAPIADAVDDYEMKDGTPFSWANAAHAAAPYENREPRFYANILYEGAKWRPRPGDVTKTDPLDRVQVGTWEKWDATNNKMIEIPGLDTRKSPIEDWNGSYTGYYMRKFIDPKVDAQYFSQDVPWRFIRYGEILLNYAEACIALGEDAEARTYINMIRKRAGLPPVTESGTALLDRYRNERRIELMFEDHRIFDVRRWVIGPEAYRPVSRAKVVYKLKADRTTSTVPTITHEVFETYKWENKAYYFPILRSELNKNNLLVQNPGY